MRIELIHHFPVLLNIVLMTRFVFNIEVVETLVHPLDSNTQNALQHEKKIPAHCFSVQRLSVV